MDTFVDIVCGSICCSDAALSGAPAVALAPDPTRGNGRCRRRWPIEFFLILLLLRLPLSSTSRRTLLCSLEGLQGTQWGPSGPGRGLGPDVVDIHGRQACIQTVLSRKPQMFRASQWRSNVVCPVATQKLLRSKLNTRTTPKKSRQDHIKSRQQDHPKSPQDHHVLNR